MNLSNCLSRTAESSTLAILDKVSTLEKQGISVIKLSSGESQFDTPSSITNACLEALQNKKTRYSNSRGILELRQAICNIYNKKYSLDLNPNLNILITPGGKQAIFYYMLSLIEQGDEVLIPSPHWGSFGGIVRLVGGTPISIATSRTNGFKFSVELLTQYITSKTKMLILNSPNNPTGSVISASDLQKIFDFCQSKKIAILSDEMYSNIVYQGHVSSSMLPIDKKLQTTAVINGFSKSHAMTGWRVGYIIAQEKMITGMLKVQQNTATCPVTFIQHACLAALSSDTEKFISQSVNYYQKNRDYLVKSINALKHFSVIAPEGGFYALVNISKFQKDSLAFSSLLLSNYNIAVVPGIAFGKACEGLVRVSLTASKNDLETFVKVLKENLD